MPNQAEGDVDKIVRRRFFPFKNDGVFVEVGAARPDFLSVSALYRQLGWHVLAIEPNPTYGELHRRLGHDVLEYACGDHDEDDVDFSIVDSHGTAYEGGGVSFESFSSLAIKDAYARLKPDLDVTKIKVKLRRLDTILAEHAPKVDHIDVIAVDVEGWEIEVLKGLSFERFKPSVLVIENLFSERSYRDFMRSKGYTLWRILAPNEVYARSDLLAPVERAVGMVQETIANLRARMRKTPRESPIKETS